MNSFFVKNKALLKKLNIVVEAVIIFAMYWLATLLRLKIKTGMEFAINDSFNFMILAIIFTVAMVIVTYISGGYFTFHIDSMSTEAKKVFLSTLIGLCVDCTIIYLFKMEQFSRLLLIYFAVLSFFAIYIKRIIFSKQAKKFDKLYQIKTNVIMLGSGRSAVTAYNTIFKPNVRTLNLLGYVANEENSKIPGYLGTYKNHTKIDEDVKIEMILIADPEMDRELLRKIVLFATNHMMRVCIIPEFSEYMPSRNAISSLAGNYLCELSAFDTCDIMGVNISVTNMEKTVNKIKDNLSDWSQNGKYICVSNVHTTVTASEDDSYKNIQNKAVIALPDGGPLSKFSREKGYAGAARVTGPDLMQRILTESPENGWKHYFYGSTQETLDKLKKVIDERYPGTNICGMMSPPFRPLTMQEDADVVKIINEADADFIWVGLGAPKQEVWMAAHEGRVKGLMIGVGAAFDYECGNIKRAPMWMQKRNLEWFYRLMQDPKRLFTRYLKTNTKYLMWKYQHGGKD